MNYFILCLGVLSSSLTFAAPTCEVPAQPKAYLEMKQVLDKKITTFANDKLIASQADTVLSRLLAAKSPVITEWMTKRDFADKSETETVKAWRQYYAQNFVLSKYPQGDKKVDAAIEKLVDQALKDNLTKAFQARMEKLFLSAQEMAITTVQEFGIEQSPALLARIKTIKLYWPKDLKSARNNSIPLDLIEWGIAYDPVPNEINMGLGSLAYADDETYLAVFAHEIGHSFDSCRWGAFFEGAWPFEKVGACLRSEKSVNAKKRDDTKMEAFQKVGKLSADLVAGLKANPTCNKLIYPPPGIQSDQLPESFADWFSAEVMSHSKTINADKLRSDLCAEKQLVDGSSYPTNAARLEKIYQAQPKIKASLKDSTPITAEYCKLK